MKKYQIGKDFSAEPSFKMIMAHILKQKYMKLKLVSAIMKYQEKILITYIQIIIRIEYVCFKLEDYKYYPQIFLEECGHKLDSRSSCLDESD